MLCCSSYCRGGWKTAWRTSCWKSIWRFISKTCWLHVSRGPQQPLARFLRCTGPDESSKFRLLEAISKMRQLVTITCYSTYLDASAFNTGLLAGFSPGWGLTLESLAFLVPHRGSRLSEDPFGYALALFSAIDHISYYRDFFVHYTILLLKINQCFHELNFLFTD